MMKRWWKLNDWLRIGIVALVVAASEVISDCVYNPRRSLDMHTLWGIVWFLNIALFGTVLKGLLGHPPKPEDPE